RHALVRHSGRVEISAHRGGGESAALASMDAYRSSVDTGAELVELDVRRTGDDELVAYHDGVVAGQLLSGLTYPRLCELAGHPVPRVTEVMELLAGRVRTHLDLKEAGYEPHVIALAEATAGAGNFLVTSLEPEAVATIKRDFPAVRVGLSLGRPLSGTSLRHQVRTRYAELLPVRGLTACGADFASMHHRLADLGVLRRCAAAGIPAMVWTVNSPAMIDRFLADPRVSVLVTDRPEYAVRRRATLTVT
ncbi:MAG: glycerophosphodiester phosphodiesterase, partial [Micromonosporaceae bacterium]